MRALNLVLAVALVGCTPENEGGKVVTAPEGSIDVAGLLSWCKQDSGKTDACAGFIIGVKDFVAFLYKSGNNDWLCTHPTNQQVIVTVVMALSESPEKWNAPAAYEVSEVLGEKFNKGCP